MKYSSYLIIQRNIYKINYFKLTTTTTATTSSSISNKQTKNKIIKQTKISTNNKDKNTSNLKKKLKSNNLNQLNVTSKAKYMYKNYPNLINENIYYRNLQKNTDFLNISYSHKSYKFVPKNNNKNLNSFSKLKNIYLKLNKNNNKRILVYIDNIKCNEISKINFFKDYYLHRKLYNIPEINALNTMILFLVSYKLGALYLSFFLIRYINIHRITKIELLPSGKEIIMSYLNVFKDFEKRINIKNISEVHFEDKIIYIFVDKYWYFLIKSSGFITDYNLFYEILSSNNIIINKTINFYNKFNDFK